MPLSTTKDGKMILQFGYGDIMIGVTEQGQTKEPFGLVLCVMDKPTKIGPTPEYDGKLVSEISSKEQIYLQFDMIASVDIFIGRLVELRNKMLTYASNDFLKKGDA